jgi:uncharacterized protein YndB with AHSA1/START domain
MSIAREGTASRFVDAPADLVFAAVTDLAKLPGWNSRMTGVVEVPATLEAGAEWVVRFRYLGSTFDSRSVVVEYDRERRRFVHRSKPDDDNPSSTLWTWEVVPESSGSRLRVSWRLQPLTPLRRMLVTPLRALQIPMSDAPASLAALARVCEATAHRR